MEGQDREEGEEEGQTDWWVCQRLANNMLTRHQGKQLNGQVRTIERRSTHAGGAPWAAGRLL